MKANDFVRWMGSLFVAVYPGGPAGWNGPSSTVASHETTQKLAARFARCPDTNGAG
jgi:hypothetical protein